MYTISNHIALYYRETGIDEPQGLIDAIKNYHVLEEWGNRIVIISDGE